MPVSSPVLKEFIRKVYRAAALAGQTNDEYLDGLADTAITALASGKTISASSGNGQSVSYEVFYGSKPESLLELINKSRTASEEATVALAVATVTPIYRVGNDFGTLSK
jgi:hypothetical protein